jgi:hypothetical protein
MQSSTAAAAAGVVRCDACGHTVPWRPQFAGRKVKCKCGHVQLVPAQPATVAATPAAAAPQPAAPSVARPAPLRPAPPPPRRPAAAPQRAASAAPSSAPRLQPSVPPPQAGQSSFDDVFGQAAQEAAAASQASPPATADDDLYDLAPGDGPAGRGYQSAAPAGGYAAPNGVGLAATAPLGVPSAVLAYRGVNRRQVEVEKEASAYGNKQLILPACLIAAGLLLTFFEARLFVGGWNVPAMLVYAVVTTVINLALIFAALLFTARILDLGLGEVAPALLKIAAVAILPAAVSGIIDHGLAKHLHFMSSYVAWFCAVLMYWFFLWLLFEMDFQEVAICTAIIWVIRTWVGMAIFLALFKALFGTGMPGYDDDGPDPGATPPAVVIPDGPGLDDGDDGGPMVVPRRPPLTQPATRPAAGQDAIDPDEDE